MWRTTAQPAVTILKPLCGAEPNLYEALCSFCTQDYPRFQIVFGLHDSRDPALSVARQLQHEFTHLEIDIVVDSRIAGSNRKVSNLANMVSAARHDYWVIADSDIRVGPEYLACIMPFLTDPRVGVVTCLYRSRACGGLWSQLSAVFINDWFAPSVLLAQLFGYRDFSSGATVGVRRASVAAIGGFCAMADYLADDYMLAALTRKLGLRTALSDYIVDNLVYEPRLSSLVGHELRWMRTLQPLSYVFLFVTCMLPLAVLGALLAWGQTLALALLGVAVLARIVLHLVQGWRAAPTHGRDCGLYR